MSRNPIFIVRFCRSRDSRAVGARDGSLIGGVDFLGAAGGLLGSLASFSGATFCREVRCDPDRVEKVADAEEADEDEEVEKDSERS